MPVMMNIIRRVHNIFNAGVPVPGFKGIWIGGDNNGPGDPARESEKINTSVLYYCP
jgi:hypothetical protein